MRTAMKQHNQVTVPRSRTHNKHHRLAFPNPPILNTACFLTAQIRRDSKQLFDSSEDYDSDSSTPLPILGNAVSGDARPPPSLSQIHQLNENLQQLTTSEPVEFEPRESQEEFMLDDIAEGMAVPGTGKRARGVYVDRY